MDPDDLDSRIRLASFAFLEEQIKIHDISLPREILLKGFFFENQRVPLVSPQGIFKPKILPEAPLTITTAPVVEGQQRPYDDQFLPDGTLRYRYRGTDPMHRDNVGLGIAMQRKTPLIYLHGIVPGRYMPFWPVFVVGDNPTSLCFTVDLQNAQFQEGPSEMPERVAELRRDYITVTALRRVHQEHFRHRVLRAYREHCAICRLKHRKLLDAAHILSDREPKGEPLVSNGLALCKLHHAAFDAHFLGIRPDHVIEIRRDILTEPDGPMLRHGLQEFHEKRIVAPRAAGQRPNPDFLAARYETFKKAG